VTALDAPVLDLDHTGFTTLLSTTRIGVNLWELDADLVYEGNTETFTAHAGFRTDFASVPRFTQTLIPRTGPWDLAAVMHDTFCVDLTRFYTQLEALLAYGVSPALAVTMIEPPMVSAVDADGLFRQMMARSGVGFCTRWSMWAAVRWAALKNPARRAGWITTAPDVLTVTAAWLAAALLLLTGWGWITAELLGLL
jgi:hypothetical protein